MFLQRQVFLGFDGRLQPGSPAAVFSNASLEFVDQFDCIILDDVVDVAPKQRFRVQRIENGGKRLHVAEIVQVAATKCRFHLGGARIKEMHVASVLIDAVIGIQPQPARDRRTAMCNLRRRHVAAGDHERNTRLIDQNRIDFIEQSRVEWLMHELARIKAKLIS